MVLSLCCSAAGKHTSLFTAGAGVLVDYLATTANLIFIVLPMQRQKAPLNMQINTAVAAYYIPFFGYMSAYQNTDTTPLNP
jgi:hypothetical protein